MNYTTEEQEALLKFVTSVDDPIYAVRDVPPEMFGALGSYFSRNPKDFRDHILDFLKGTLTEDLSLPEEQRIKQRQENLKKFLQSNYQPPGEILKAGMDKSRDFFTRWYGKYGHKSIANVVWQGFVGMNQSQLVARQLAFNQLAFFIEMSTRYVDFNSAQWYKDPDIMNSEFATLYCETMEMLIRTYNYFIEHGKRHYKKKYSFDLWKQKQIVADTQKGDAFLNRKYDREITAKAFDIARYCLPQAMPTNFAWILDARSAEFDIAAWKEHPLAEIRNAAAMIEKAGGQQLPSLLKYTENNKYYGDKLHRYQEDFKQNIHGIHGATTSSRPLQKKVHITHFHPGALELILSHVLANNNALSFEEAKKIIQHKPEQEKIQILKRLIAKRSRFDEWVDPAFQMVNIGVEFVSDVGAVRDLRRHQKNERCEQLYTLDLGYAEPLEMKEIPKDVQQTFRQAMEQTHEAEKKMRAKFPFQVQYILPMATLTQLRMNMDLDQVQYMIYTRSTPEGHPSYRQDVFNLCEEVAKIYPWMLGYETYPEGKHIFDVYREAPLKDIIRMRTDETQLHQ